MNCRLCGGKTELRLKLKDTPIANNLQDKPGVTQKYPLHLVQCTDCDHVQIGHVIPDNIIFTNKYVYSTPEANRPYLLEHANKLAKIKTGFAVEIGSNNGIFIDILSSVGFKVAGVDPCGTGTTFWREPFNKHVAQRIINRAGMADLIVANNVFAHINNLDEVFEGILTLLDSKGTLVFEVQYFKDMADNGLFDMIYHEHRDYHTINPLLRYVLNKGLYPNLVERIPNHGGSIRFYCSFTDYSDYPVDEKIDWDAFKAKIDKTCAKKLNSGTALFGAPAKATTLVHNMECMDKIAFCVDDTPAKQGKYLPGTNIKILPTSEINGFKGDVLLTAWNYKDVIQKKYPDVKFINPHD